jgi:hypothetical protein
MHPGPVEYGRASQPIEVDPRQWYRIARAHPTFAKGNQRNQWKQSNQGSSLIPLIAFISLIPSEMADLLSTFIRMVY